MARHSKRIVRPAMTAAVISMTWGVGLFAADPPVRWPPPPSGSGDPELFATALCVGAGGQLWVGTEGGGLGRFDPAAPAGKQVTSFTARREGLGDDDVYALAIDPRGRVWAGHRSHGVSVFDGQQWLDYDVVAGVDRPGSRAGPLGERVFAIRVCPTTGDVWIATDAGLTRYGQADDRWTYVTRADGLPSDATNAIAFDKAGNVYVGTQCDGVAMADAAGGYAHWRSVTGPIAPPTDESGAGLPTNQVNDVLVTPDGTVYVATTTGLAWSADRGRSWRFLRGADWVDKVEQSTAGRPAKWAGNADAPLAEDCVRRLSQDPAGHLYLGYRSAGVVRYDRGPDGAPLPASATVVIATKNPIDALPDDMGRVQVAATYGGALEAAAAPGLAPTTMPAVEPPPMPSSAAAPDLAILARSIPASFGPTTNPATRATTTTAPAAPAVFTLDDDWRTRGAWLGRYGRYWAYLAGMDGPGAYLWGTGGRTIEAAVHLGPHAQPNDGPRYWISTNYATDPRGLEIPSIYFDSRIRRRLTTFNADRRISELNDNGEVYADAWEGPDLQFKVAHVPAGPFVLSAYLMNDDGHLHAGKGRNRWRDFPIEVRVLASPDAPLDDGPPAAASRTGDCFGGVYKRFLVRGPCDLSVCVRRNYGQNVVVSALMLDGPDERPTPYFDTPPPPSPSTPAGRIADALRDGPDRDPRWWSFNHRRLATLLARWCQAQPGDRADLQQLRACAAHYAGLHAAAEQAQRALELTPARDTERDLRWDGVAPNSSGNEPDLLAAFLRFKPKEDD